MYIVANVNAKKAAVKSFRFYIIDCIKYACASHYIKNVDLTLVWEGGGRRLCQPERVGLGRRSLKVLTVARPGIVRCLTSAGNF